MSEDIDHEFTDEVVCPHCGNEHLDSQERRMNDGDEQHDKCDECGKPFVIYACVSVTYSTEKCEPKP